MPMRPVADLAEGDTLTFYGRPCTVAAAPEPTTAGKMRLTLLLPGGAPQHVIEDGDRQVQVLR